MKENRVTRKKKTCDQNLNNAISQQREKDKAGQFGVSGTGIGMAGSFKQSDVGA